MFKTIKNKVKNINKYYWIIIAVALFMIAPLMSDKYFDGHDTDYHISNVIAIDENISIKNGVLIPQKIMPIIANDFGYASSIFYPKLPHYLITGTYMVSKQFSPNINYAMSISHFITILLSGIFMFKLSKNIFKNDTVALLTSVFYMTFPYHLSDIYIRDAFAETLLFVFTPMIFLSLYYLVNNNNFKFYILFILGYFGAVNSHIVISVYLTFFIIIYMILNYKTFMKKDIILSLSKASIIILLLISPFVIPMLQHKIYGNYFVFANGSMATAGSVLWDAMHIGDYFVTSSYKCIGFIALIMSFVAMFNYNKIDSTKEQKKFIISIFVLSIITFFMTLKIFPWTYMPSMLLNIQFPWRLQYFLGFCLSLIAGFGILSFAKKDRENISFILIIISCILGVFIINNSTIYSKDSANIDYSKAGMGYQKEYLPVNTINNIEYFDNRVKNEVVIVNGNGSIKNIVSQTPYLRFEVETNEEVLLELPRLFYFGYKIKLINDNKEEILDYLENEYGFIEINVNKSGIIEVQYTGTILNKISQFLFIVGVIISIIYIVIQRKIASIK